MKFSKMTMVAAGTLIFSACGGGSSLGGLDAEATYTIALTSAAEVPAPKTTTASGSAVVIVYPNSIDYQLSGTAISSVSMAHIHSGAPGVAGPVVVTLYLPGTPSGAIAGIFANGTLTAGNLPSGVTLESLKALILSGNAYINVHTTANPGGEIRGQLR